MLDVSLTCSESNDKVNPVDLMMNMTTQPKSMQKSLGTSNGSSAYSLKLSDLTKNQIQPISLPKE